jgi:hypothetical protein
LVPLLPHGQLINTTSFDLFDSILWKWEFCPSSGLKSLNVTDIRISILLGATRRLKIPATVSSLGFATLRAPRDAFRYVLSPEIPSWSSQ